MSSDDSAFLELPARLRRRIDSAFDSVAPQLAHEASAEAGGFIVEESGSQSGGYEAGGFIIEDQVPSNPVADAQSHIPLSEIPRALGFLDLLPDDEIMGVFKNAAAGWGAQDARSDGVSRKDWRAVCAALLEGEHADEEDLAVNEDIDIESEPDSDEYRGEEQSSDSEEVSGDEYEPEEPIGKGKKPQRAARRTPTRTDIPRQLTEPQKARCRQDFARFFPHVPDEELGRQRIMIKDITRVADLLKENIKAEEIVEMLEAFSTSADTSVSLADFEHMMIVTKLV